jgi:Zn-finger nucleic acid-binding protein
MKCPKDHCDMEEKDIDVIDAVTLDACPKCDGVWMDKGELKRISKDDLIDLRFTPKGVSLRLCPRCGRQMNTSEFKSVMVDECVCGIYFDKGEADKVLGKTLALRSKGGKYSIGVTVAQMKELLDKGSVNVEPWEMRLIKD